MWYTNKMETHAGINFIRSRKPAVGLDLAPLVDIIFLLLVFFMLSSTFRSPSFKIDLPQASSADVAQTEALLVSLGADQKIYVNQEPSSLEGLLGVLRVRLSGMDQKAVHVRGDKNISYGLFVQVMDRIRQAGVEQIHIVHQEDHKR